MAGAEGITGAEGDAAGGAAATGETGETGAGEGGGMMRGIGIEGAPPDSGGRTGIDERIGGIGIESGAITCVAAFVGSGFTDSGFTGSGFSTSTLGGSCLAASGLGGRAWVVALW